MLGFIPWERRKAFKMSFSIVMGQKSQMWTDLPAIESFRLNQCIYEIGEESFRARWMNWWTCSMCVRCSKCRYAVVAGERMKMELIASLLHRPRVLLLDERPSVWTSFHSAGSGILFGTIMNRPVPQWL